MPWPWNSDEPEYETPVGEEKRDSCLVVLVWIVFAFGISTYGLYNLIV